MIVTLTLNPAVDQTVWVRRLRVGGVNRFGESQLDPAGKGVNVSRMAHRLGWPTIAFGFLAGETGALVDKALDSERVPHHFVPLPGLTRVNMAIIDEESGAATHLFGAGPEVSREHLERLNEMLRFWLQAGRVLVLAGSLPPGVPDDIYAACIDLARSHGVKTVLDADEEALRLGVEAKPHLIKPNVAEAERLLGHPLRGLAAVLEGARELQTRGIAVVVISLGAQGAVCAEGGRAWLAVPPEVTFCSAVGSGDSLVAGLAVALARGDSVVEGLRLGSAAGAATAATPGTALGSTEAVQALLPQVHIEPLDGEPIERR